MKIEELLCQLESVYTCNNLLCQQVPSDPQLSPSCSCRDYKTCIDQLKSLGITEDYQIIRIFASYPQKTIFSSLQDFTENISGKLQFTKFQELHQIHDYLSKVNFGSVGDGFFQNINGLDLFELQSSTKWEPLSPTVDFDKIFFGDWASTCGIFSPGTLTEISGRASSGRTQFCLSLAAYVLVYHLKRFPVTEECSTWLNPVVFIDTGGDFTVYGLLNHLLGIIEVVLKPENDESRSIIINKCLSLISHFNCTNYEDFLSTVAHLESKHKVSKSSTRYPRFIIADNVYSFLGSLFQPTKSTTQPFFPGQLLITEAVQSLRRLSIELSCPVLLTNTTVRRYQDYYDNSNSTTTNIGKEARFFQSGLGSTLPYLIDNRFYIVRLPELIFECRLDQSHIQSCPIDCIIEFDGFYGLISKPQV